MIKTLHVEPATTETSPGEFVTDGFRVVAKDGVTETAIYQSRHANKAMTKAFVLLGSPEYADYVVTVSGPDVTDVAGKLNLAQRLDAERFQAIRALALMDPPIDEIVEVVKTQPTEG